MDGRLTQISDSLAPPEEFIRRGNAIQDRLTRVMQGDKTYRIDRVRLAGGMQKKTSIRSSADYDMVAFLNGKESSPAVLQHFKGVVAKEFGLDETKIKNTPRSLNFTVDGIDFDLLFAKNLVQTHSVAKLQNSAMLQQIKISGDPVKTAADLSAGLTEAAFEFVKQQSAFVHKVARLAKYWNSTIFYTKYLNGRSSIFELLGIAAGREEEENNRDNPSFLRAFRLFLRRVETISRQTVVFTDFYAKSEIPRHILQQKPLLLDPSSPYNNFMHNFEHSVQELFSECARESLNRLEMVERQVQLNHGFPEFRVLFLPQPKPVQVGPQIRLPMPTDWLVGTESRAKHLQPNLIVRNPSLGNDKYILANIKKILSAFMFVADLEAQHKGVEKKQFAEDAVKETIDDLFGNRRGWSSSNDRHEPYDVTFEIPIGREGRDTLIVSTNWASL